MRQTRRESSDTVVHKARPGDTRVDKETGEVLPIRFEADAGLHFQGDGETAWGCKFVITAVRSTKVHGRIIVDTRHSPDVGGEAKTAMEALRSLAPLAPGALGVVYDTALRGKHHAELMRDYGMISINRVQAAEVVVVDGKPKKRVEKTLHIEDKIVNGKTVRLYSRGGAIGIGELDADGKQRFLELKRVKTTRRTDKNGKYWFYNLYACRAARPSQCTSTRQRKTKLAN